MEGLHPLGIASQMESSSFLAALSPPMVLKSTFSEVYMRTSKKWVLLDFGTTGGRNATFDPSI